MKTTLHVALAALLGASGCGGPSEDGDGPLCTGAKCDLPDDPTERTCTLRRADAFNENQRAYTEEFVRWSCADTEGVTGLDRGQEYCEYFAVVQLPPEEEGAAPPEPSILGRLIRYPPEDPEDPESYPSFDTTPLEVELSANQVWELEEDPTGVVGQCVFTSWNQDIAGPVPACEPEAQQTVYSDQMPAKEDCPEVVGVPVDAENFRMKGDINSAEAGQFLVEDCMTNYAEPGDPKDPEDPRHDDFLRGCLLNAEVNQTEFRKSDSTLCASAVRMAECECYATTRGAGLPEALSPFERRGFPLGTWSGAEELPSGCRYVPLGDGSRTVVSCDLTAQDVLTYPSSLKNLCRERYAPNVVVHVPIPSDSIVCFPEQSSSPYADSCSDTPWVVEE